MNKVSQGFLAFATLLTATVSQAQENSPYSRYALGDKVPNASVFNRGMGGISAGFADYDSRYDFKQIYPKPQTVNFLNPASYGKIRITSFDLGFEVDTRTLREEGKEKFQSENAIVSYLQLGLPLSRKHGVGMAVGLRPSTRINYKILTLDREPGIDSVSNLYEGNGGSYEAFIGLGKSFKNFSFGFNTGYYFGNKNYSTKKQFIPESADVFYYSSNYESNSNFGGVFFQAGAQYSKLFNASTRLTIGAYGNLRGSFNANQDLKRETFNFSNSGAVIGIDSVYTETGIEGTIETPAQLGVGFTLERLDRWMFGADFVQTSWSQYRFFGISEPTRDSWIVKVGGQFTPNPFAPKSYWSRVSYRLGFNYGQDYLDIDGNLPFYHISGGLGLPIRKSPYTNQYTNINLALEYGSRGNNNNTLKENFFRVALGFSLSDLWFVKRRYD
jgi:hypothetical protein